MSREIKEAPPVVLTSKSFDGKHELVFNEASHRYKLDGKAVTGVTTFQKNGYPTSMGLISWYKAQTGLAVLNALTVPGKDGLVPREGFFPLSKERCEEIIKEAKNADRAVSQEAADIGTICHAYAELYSVGKINEANAILQEVKDVPTFHLIKSCVDKYIEWEKTNKGILVHAEAIVASPKYLFSGKFDRLDRVGKKLILRDYKTSKDIFLDQYIQLAAYAIAIKEWLGLNVEGLEVLRFGKDDGAFETLLIDDPKEILMFKAQAIRCYDTHMFRKLENDPRWKWEK